MKAADRTKRMTNTWAADLPPLFQGGFLVFMCGALCQINKTCQTALVFHTKGGNMGTSQAPVFDASMIQTGPLNGLEVEAQYDVLINVVDASMQSYRPA